MDATTAFGLAKGILDFSVRSASLTYQQILAVKAALPSMDLTPYEKEIVIGRMRYQQMGYEIEAHKRLTKMLQRQIAASKEKRRQQAIKKSIKSPSWLSKISQQVQGLFGFYNNSYESVQTFSEDLQTESQQLKNNDLIG